VQPGDEACAGRQVAQPDELRGAGGDLLVGRLIAEEPRLALLARSWSRRVCTVASANARPMPAMRSMTPTTMPPTSRFARTGFGAVESSGSGVSEGPTGLSGTWETANASPQRGHVIRCPTARPGVGGMTALQNGQVRFIKAF
jgi:hypothetical protein